MLTFITNGHSVSPILSTASIVPRSQKNNIQFGLNLSAQNKNDTFSRQLPKTVALSFGNDEPIKPKFSPGDMATFLASKSRLPAPSEPTYEQDSLTDPPAVTTIPQSGTRSGISRQGRGRTGRTTHRSILQSRAGESPQDTVNRFLDSLGQIRLSRTQKIEYVKEALQLLDERKKTNRALIARTYAVLGELTSPSEEAIEHFNKALEIIGTTDLKEIKEPRFRIAAVRANIGLANIYLLDDSIDLDKAVECHRLSKQLWDYHHDLKRGWLKELFDSLEPRIEEAKRKQA